MTLLASILRSDDDDAIGETMADADAAMAEEDDADSGGSVFMILLLLTAPDAVNATRSRSRGS